jgi:hypothetical protein
MRAFTARDNLFVRTAHLGFGGLFGGRHGVVCRVFQLPRGLKFRFGVRKNLKAEYFRVFS